jgi:two-component system response regulator MtrA
VGLGGFGAGRRFIQVAEDEMARIVYVEDDKIVSDLVKEILSRRGHFVTVMDDGTLAFDTIAFKKPDLVILDWQLPGMEGLDILRTLRRDGAQYRPPVLMVTAKAGEDSISEAMSAGASDYLVKPFASEDLVNRVAKILHENAAGGLRSS